jgi:cytoskeletal protein CcmA (bactofilin family)
MDVVLPVLLLIAIVTAWAYLPLAPAVRELQEATDVAPVRVVQASAVDVHHFARGYRSFLEEHLAAAMARCRNLGRPQHGQLDEGIPYSVVTSWDGKTPPVGMIVCSRSLAVPARGVFRFEMYAAGSMVGGELAVYKAVLAERDIDLAPRSTSLRWLHAGLVVRVGRDSRLHGRVSAGTAIELADGCFFERLNAPRITFGRDVQVARPTVARTPLTVDDVEHVLDPSAGRWLIRGEAHLPPARSVETDLVATGDVRVGKDVQVIGSIKSRRDVYLGMGVEVHGSVVARRHVYMSEGCIVHGPILAENTIFIGTGCRIGSPSMPTTVGARRIHLSEGVVAHGTVWAHHEGVVAARTPNGA